LPVPDGVWSYGPSGRVSQNVNVASERGGTREEGDRREKLIGDLKKALASETTAAGKVAAVARAVKDEPSPNVRRVVFEAIPVQPGPELDAFLTDVMTGDAGDHR
jgi:hypothetical protein